MTASGAANDIDLVVARNVAKHVPRRQDELATIGKGADMFHRKTGLVGSDATHIFGKLGVDRDASRIPTAEETATVFQTRQSVVLWNDLVVFKRIDDTVVLFDDDSHRKIAISRQTCFVNNVPVSSL